MPLLTGPSREHNRNVFVTAEIEIARPADAVWPYLVDWERLDRWMSEGSRFRVLSAEREGVGVVAEARVRIGGIQATDQVMVTQWTPPWALEIAHLGWVKGSGYMELTPIEAGTHVFWREELVPPWGILGAIGLRLFRPKMRRLFAHDLRLLRELVESEA